MKTALFQIAGVPQPKDLIMLGAGAPGGGRSTAKYVARGREIKAEINGEEVRKVVVEAETPSEIGEKLAWEINHGKEFLQGAFNASVKGDLLVIACADTVSNVTFFPQIDGTGNVTIEQL